MAALLSVGSDVGAAFAAVSVVVAIRNDSVGWLVLSTFGVALAVLCALLRSRWVRD